MGLLAGFYIGFSFTTMMLIGGQVRVKQCRPRQTLCGHARMHAFLHCIFLGLLMSLVPACLPAAACPLKAKYAVVARLSWTRARMAWTRARICVFSRECVCVCVCVCVCLSAQIPEIMHGENPGLYNLILGAFGFPLGLFIICVVGADLFTSNMGYMLTALHEGRVTFWHLIKVRLYCVVLEHAAC